MVKLRKLWHNRSNCAEEKIHFVFNFGTMCGVLKENRRNIDERYIFDLLFC